jgi:hypothetical protein
MSTTATGPYSGKVEGGRVVKGGGVHICVSLKKIPYVIGVCTNKRKRRISEIYVLFPENIKFNTGMLADLLYFSSLSQFHFSTG